MLLSFKNPHIPMRDIIYLIFAPIHASLTPKEIINKIKASSWMELVTAAFLKGYITAYPKKDWPTLFTKLITKIKKWGPPYFYKEFKNVMDKQFEIVKQYIKSTSTLTNQYYEIFNISFTKLPISSKSRSQINYLYVLQ